MPEKWTIILDNGIMITDLTLNGNNFISKTEITESAFDGGLTHVVFKNGDYEEHHENMELVQISQCNGEWWFVLVEIPKTELERRKFRSDIDYIAMMSDIDF